LSLLSALFAFGFLAVMSTPIPIVGLGVP
jgi:hypothetical protein